ncbi:integrator complex subunit 12, partial [Brachionus plicatilis]
DDNVKQLEDLWESFEKTNSNDLKRSFPTDCSNGCDSAAKKPKLNTGNPSKHKSRAVQSDSADQSSSSSLSTTGSSSLKSPQLDDLFDDEMLDMDLNCFVCKKMNQDRNNKLVECKACAKLYHQKCHSPAIDETRNFAKYQQENKMSWFIEQCQSCSRIANEEDEQTRMSPNSLREPTKGLAGLANKFSGGKLTRPNDYRNSKLSASAMQQNQKSVFNLPPISVNTKK